MHRDRVDGLNAEAITLALAGLAAHACADRVQGIAGNKAVGGGAIDPVADVIGGVDRGHEKLYEE